MIGDQAAALLRDVFGLPELFAGLPRITRRIVSWGEQGSGEQGSGEQGSGEQGSPSDIPHSAVVLSEQDLLRELPPPEAPLPNSKPDFTVITGGPLPVGVASERFGSRRATAARVVLRDPRQIDACCIESLPGGWLFLIPAPTGLTWLLAIGEPLATLLPASQVIAPRIEVQEIVTGEFSTCPRIAQPLCGPDWILCGSAALAFDPICGDGTAQAVREAILAAAVIRGIAAGGDSAALLAYYQTRLLAGVQKHLALCHPYYETGGSGAWWQAEAASLTEGFRWCAAKLRNAPEPRYLLRGFDLTERDPLTIN